MALIQDNWLSERMRIPSYSLKVVRPYYPLPLPDDQEFFVQAKLQCFDLAGLLLLQAHGFEIIERGIILSRTATGAGPLLHTDLLIRQAIPEDELALRALAGEAFSDDRFRRDPRIATGIAERIKSDWVGGFFSDSGDRNLFIAEFTGKLAGFLLLKRLDKRSMQIELVTTSPEYRRIGVSKSLFRAVIETVGSQDTQFTVKTQAHNFRALSLYSSLGFVPVNSELALHFHRKSTDR